MIKCRAALNIKGEHFPCDNENVNHEPLAHSNADAEAIWASHDEVKDWISKDYYGPDR